MFLEALGQTASGLTRCCGGPNLFKRDSGLLAERGEIEIDDLTDHPSIAERHHVGEGHDERTSAGWDSEPVSATGSAKRAPHDDSVISERHPLVGGGEIGE